MQHPDTTGGGHAATDSTSALEYAAPSTTTENDLAEVLAAIVGAENVSVESNFFDDLGADSMVMARFCARVRKRSDLPPVSMKDIYKHRTIRSLAVAVSETQTELIPTPAPRAEVEPAAKTWEYALCGLLQLVSMLGYLYVLALVGSRSYDLISAGSGLLAIAVRSLVSAGADFLAMCTFPIVLKWMLIGRWKPQRIRIWSLRYARFWFVKTLVQLNPVILFAGTPIYTLYLRALGAKIGRDALIFSSHVPVCTDLLTVGDGAIVRKDTFFNGYRAHAGVIQTGRVTLGRDSFVGEMAVLDIDTSLGDRAQLGHSSSLHVGQSLPDDERRYGSPARQPTDVDYRAPETQRCSSVRKFAYSMGELLALILVLSLSMAGGVALFHELAERPAFAALGSGQIPNWTQLGDMLAVSLALFLGGVLVALGFVLTFPRLLHLAIQPDRDYRLYGFHYWAHRTIERVTNIKFFPRLFGDSSYIVHYLSWLGYDLKPIVQTGSNFGLHLKHSSPFHVSVGSGTMVADGLSIINAAYSSTSFRVFPVRVGRESFIGNQVAYPLQAKTGDNCLLANKVMVPVDGDVREGVGLLGSPPFEIPRTVLRDSEYEVAPEKLGRRLAAKNKHNLVTIGLFLGVHWVYATGLITLAATMTGLYSAYGEELVIALGFMPVILFRIFYFVLVERLGALFRTLQPRICSIYDPYFWFHERYWKLMARTNEVRIVDGTPLKGLIWRALGVRMGKRLFDDGCGITEATMVRIGDDCTFNVSSFIQPHSQEDGGFKSDRISIGDGCTLGVAAWVHYGVTMGDGVQLDADTFVMKGEEVPAHARWGENPAREVRESSGAAKAITTAAPSLPAANCRAAASNGGQLA